MDKILSEVQKFLKKQIYCTFSTCSSGISHSTVVMYASKGMEIYFFTGKKTKKFKNLSKNPNASVTVSGKRFIFFPRAVEMVGIASILQNDDSRKPEKIYFSKKRPEYIASKRIWERYETIWVRFAPQKIFTYGFGSKPWTIDPEKQFQRVL